MKKKKIYLIMEFGGHYDDSWDHITHAYTKREDADAHVKKMEDKQKLISDELFDEIEEAIDKEEDAIWDKYHLMTEDGTGHLLKEGCTEQMYDDEQIEFDSIHKYEMIKEKFGIDKELYEFKEYQMFSDFIGYRVLEVELD